MVLHTMGSFKVQGVCVCVSMCVCVCGVCPCVCGGGGGVPSVGILGSRGSSQR